MVTRWFYSTNHKVRPVQWESVDTYHCILMRESLYELQFHEGESPSPLRTG